MTGRAAAAPLTVTNDAQNWTFQLDGDWVEGDASEEPGILRLWHHRETDRVLVLSRMRGNTDAAWGDKPAREAFFDGVESGMKKGQTDYRRLARKAHELGPKKVPALDLWFRSGSGSERRVVGARFVFFRTIGFMLVVESPKKRQVERDARRMLESFQPLK